VQHQEQHLITVNPQHRQIRKSAALFYFMAPWQHCQTDVAAEAGQSSAMVLKFFFPDDILILLKKHILTAGVDVPHPALYQANGGVWFWEGLT
jgi:hypothetical protein